MSLFLLISVLSLPQEEVVTRPISEIAAVIGQSKFETSLQQREAVDFLWVPGELIYDAIEKGNVHDQTIMADFIVTTRIKRTGGTDVLFVRYFVDESGIRFFVLHGEPCFTSSQFPITPVTFGAAWKSNGETAVYSTHRDLNLSGRVNRSDPQLSFSDLHYNVSETLSSPRLFVGNTTADGVEKGELRVVGDSFEQTSILPQMVYSVPTNRNFLVNLKMRLTGQDTPEEERNAMTLKEVPVCYRFGGRTIRSTLRKESSVGGVVIPRAMIMTSRTPELTDASCIARAELMRCCSAERNVMDDGYRPDFRLFQSFRSLSPHWGQFQTDAAQAELKRFENAFNTPGIATPDRLAYHGRMTIVHIFADDRSKLSESVNGYIDDAISLGLKEVLLEMLYPMLVRTDWSGSHEAYSLVLTQGVLRSKSISPSERVASAAHLRHFGIAPYALFRLAFPEGVSAAIDEEEPVQALRSLHLAASLCPAFAREIGEGAGKWFLAADVELARNELGKEGFSKLCNEIRRMTGKTLAVADPKLKNVWFEEIDAIHSWTKGE